MPFLKVIGESPGRLGLWALEESPEELAGLISLPESDQARVTKFSSKFRIREFLAVRILLSELLGFYPEIDHDPQNRPFLINSPMNLSISHSRSMVAVILSDRPAGVDTEETNRDISTIAGRFMHPDEISWASLFPDPNTARILCWSIKETVFKAMGIQNVEFRTMIRIEPVLPAWSGTIPVTFRYREKEVKLNVNYLFDRNNVVTWCELP